MKAVDVAVEGVRLDYPCGTRALQNVDLEIPAGSTFGIVGPNGAGKSTLINLICGFQAPSGGRITIGGHSVIRRNLGVVRELLGVVFQNADDQLFQPSVLEDVCFGLRNRGVSPSTAAVQATEILSRFGLETLAKIPPHRLSSGQKRFVALCGVLVMDPGLLLLDEPTSDLDPRNRRSFLDVFRSLSMTRVVVSHDLDFVWDSCESMAILDSGKVVATGCTKEILRDEALLKQHHLELPLRFQ